MAQLTVTNASPARLVDAAKAQLVVVRVGDVGPLIGAGAIRVNDHIGSITELVRGGDVLTIDPGVLAAHALQPEDLSLAICHEDDDLVVVDKPARMHVHPLGPHRTGTLLNGLLWHCGARVDQPWGRWRPSPLHRLDRAATGLVAFAKTAAIHDVMRRLFVTNGIERRYHARVHGTVSGDRGTIDAPLGRDPTFDYRRAVVPVAAGGQRAVTHWTVLARGAEHTLVEVVLETGRTHQIRVHFASIGHPIVGDTIYRAGATRSDASKEIALYAVELRLRHPRTGELLVCTPLRGDRRSP